MFSGVSSLLLLLFLIFYIGPCSGVKINLKSGTIDTNETPQFSVEDYNRQKTSLLTTQVPSRSILSNNELYETQLISKEPLVMINLDSDVFQEQVENEWGVSLGNHYLNSNSFLSRVPLDKLSQVPDSVKWVGYYDYTHKTNIRLQNVAPSTATKKPLRLTAVLLGEEKDHVESVAHINNILAQLPGEASFKVNSRRRATIYIQPTIMKEALGVILNMENVVWIEYSFPHEIKNKYSRSIMQAGYEASSQDTPIWDKGLKGEGQTVSILDTGLDWDNCFFRDPDHDTPPQSTVSMSRRKVVGYYRTNSSVLYSDPVNGHGTHVAGTVAGSILSSENDYDQLNPFNGMASEAKILFNAMEDAEGGLRTPEDFEPLNNPLQQADSHIVTNSWGSVITPLIRCEFDCDCVWGPVAEQFGFTPGDPVDDSWCREQVGTDCCYGNAVYNSYSAMLDDFLNENDEDLVLFAASNDGTQSSETSISNEAAAKNVLVVGSSNTAPEEFDLSPEYADTLQYADANGYESSEACCNANPGSVCCRSYWETAYSNTVRYNTTSVTNFSSRGPTLDGRIRPDVVAPGHIVISTHSDGDPTSNQCGTSEPRLGNNAALLQMSGTSMATPGVAGAAAVVREYYTKGFYPSGSASSSDSMTPSGPLLKATIIHSGQSLTRTIDGNDNPISVGNTPNKYEGWGLVKLDSVLRFSDSDFHLTVADRRGFDAAAQTDEWNITASSSGVVKATLTWYDPAPSASSSASTTLINRLDLSVGSETDTGNDVTKQLSTVVEPGSTVKVSVTAATLRENEYYALVITHPEAQVSHPPNREISSESSSDSDSDSSSSTLTISIMTSMIATVALLMLVMS
eukprot:gb/GECH01011686.1/.p1 GENE.gb/GECH01011686.1/~~gb/GECH01011686.1/.p1  ORF type:complete len:855 (+),score=160.67 gb/GECH01011686.1/:1-2565(+)